MNFPGDTPPDYEGNTEQFVKDYPPGMSPDDSVADWNNKDWGGGNEEVTLSGDTIEVKTKDYDAKAETTNLVKSTENGPPSSPQFNSAAKAAATEQMNGDTTQQTLQ